MSSTHYATDGTAGIELDKAYSSAAFELGSRIMTNKGMATFLKANGAVAKGAACRVKRASDANDADEITTAISASLDTDVVVALAALADNEYGFFMEGPFQDVDVLVATGISADAALTTTTTAGTVGAGGDAISGLIANAANASGGDALTSCSATQKLSTN